MDHKPNHRCRVCGKEYYACISCADRQRQQYGIDPWRSIADTTTHYQIYILMIRYTRHEETAWEIRQQLERLDLSDLETFPPQNQALIREILMADNPDKEQEPIAEPVKKMAKSSRRISKAAPVETEDGVTDADGE